MSSGGEIVFLEACTPCGTIKVTDSALRLAERFQASVPAGWIAVFSWFDGRQIRAGNDAPCIDQGAGLGLGAYRIEQIPNEAICYAGSLSYAVCIRRDIVDSHPEKTIDLDEAGHVILR